jgi:hypothetical protein
MIICITVKSSGKKTYWLIRDKLAFIDSFEAVKCSSTGKMYKSYNSYNAEFLRKLTEEKFLDGPYATYQLIREATDAEPVKANIEASVKTTALKNRISYLERLIARSTKELEVKKTQLDALKD